MYYTLPPPSSSSSSVSSSSISSSDISSIGSTLVNLLTSLLFPSSSSGSVTNISPGRMNSVLSVQQPSASGSLSLSRAALGWTTTVAISLILVQWVGNKDEKKTTPLDWITRILSTFWNDQQRTFNQASSTKNGRGNNNNTAAKEPMTVLLNRGSCHCGSITFKLTPAREVRVIQSPLSGKLQYPTARVPSDQLHLVSGKHLWNTYHVRSDETGETWAYSFCKHCAIHLLHATDADQSSLFVNLQCFNIPDAAYQQQQQQRSMSSSSSSNFFVPRVLTTTDGEDSVVTKTSVISTVTAATQKSLLTNVTSLPEYANPRTFGQNQRQQQYSSSQHSVEEDSGDTDSAAPVERRIPRAAGRKQRPTTPKQQLSPMMEQHQQRQRHQQSHFQQGGGWNAEDPRSFPRGVVAYSADSRRMGTATGGLPPRARSLPPVSPSSSSAAMMMNGSGGAGATGTPRSHFEHPVAPVAGWPAQQEVDGEEEEDDDDVRAAVVEDDKDSISSHSGDMDFFSSEDDGHHTPSTTSATTSTTSSAAAAATAEYSRERMLQNMRKHLKLSKPVASSSTAMTASSSYSLESGDL